MHVRSARPLATTSNSYLTGGDTATSAAARSSSMSADRSTSRVRTGILAAIRRALGTPHDRSGPGLDRCMARTSNSPCDTWYTCMQPPLRITYRAPTICAYVVQVVPSVRGPRDRPRKARQTPECLLDLCVPAAGERSRYHDVPWRDFSGVDRMCRRRRM